MIIYMNYSTYDHASASIDDEVVCYALILM